ARPPPPRAPPARRPGPRPLDGAGVRGLDDGQVRETACDGEGEQRPEYRVTEAVDARSRCPASTTLYVRLGGSSPVGCAVPV
ncbi:hypothetical protein ACFWHX_12785, partial [Streptomyces hirsutus]